MLLRFKAPDPGTSGPDAPPGLAGHLRRLVQGALALLHRSGFFHLLSANFLIQFLGFGTLLLVPRFVTVAELGEIKVIQSYAALFLILATFGFDNTVLKLCSEDRPEDERQYFLKAALLRALWATVAAFALLAGLAFSGVLAETPRLARWTVIYALVLPFGAFTTVMASYLQARKRIKEMARAQTMVKLQSVVLVVLATWLFGFEGFLLATVIAYALGLWPFLRQIGLAFLRRVRRPLPKLFMNMAVFTVLSNGIHTLGKHADIYILGLFHTNADEIGYYSLALIFLLGASVVTSTVQRIVMPYFSERSADETWVRHTVLKTQLQLTALSVGVAVGVHVAAWLVITLLYEPHYLRALAFLDILLVYYVVRSSYAVLGVTMISLGLPRFNFIGACLTTPFGLVVAYLGLQYYGITGVAWARVATAVFTLLVLMLITRHALKTHYASQ